jgi:SpoVK/Ycf46/Vps4 family AAA+-type ATPase
VEIARNLSDSLIHNLNIRHSNVFILCTSNIEKALDSAFIDRIGLIRYIGHPSEQATVAILANCIQEMLRTGLLINTHECSEENMANRYREIAR